MGYLRQHDPFLPGETTIEFLQRDSGQAEWKCGEVAGKFELKGDYLSWSGFEFVRWLANTCQVGRIAAARTESIVARRANQLPGPENPDPVGAFFEEIFAVAFLLFPTIAHF